MDPNDLIAEAAMELLREHGPQTAADWGNLLADAGHGTPDDMTEFVEYVEDPLLGYLTGSRYAALDTLFEHRILTHRLTDAEISSGVLDANPDLMVLRVFLDSFDDTEDREIRVVHRGLDDAALAERGIDDPTFPADEGFLLAPDALSECAAGDLIGLFVADRELTLCTVADVVDPTPGFADALANILTDTGAETLDAIVWQLMLEEPTLFRQPAAPLGELLESAGYVRDGDYVAIEGFDFEAFHMANRARMLEIRDNLHPDEAAAVIALVDLVSAAHLEFPEDTSEIGDWARAQITENPQIYVAVAEPPAAAAALELLSELDDHDEILHAVATALADKGPRRVKPAAYWLAGKAADRLGKVIVAEAYYESALDRDPDWVPAIFELALLAADRSDATRALALLGRIEGGESEILHDVLARYAPAEHPELGRNDKCWCGSGRKYKVCHLGKVDESVREDGRWLYKKACMFAFSSEFADMVVQFDDLVAAGSDDDDRSIFDGPALDIALFEGGIFAQFITRRGNLLTEHEVATARQWLDVERSVFEVTEMNTLLDRRTGDTVTVSGAADLEPGDLVCARVLPAGSSAQVVGSVIVSSELQAANVLQVLGRDHHDVAELIRVLS